MKLFSTFLFVLLIGIQSASPVNGFDAVTIDLGHASDDLLIASPEGYPEADYTFGSLPVGSEPLSGDGQGLTVVLDEGEGFLLYGPAVDVGHGVVLIQGLIQTTNPGIALAVAGLNVPAGGALSDLDGSIALSQPANGQGYTGIWGELELFYDPEGDAVAPVFQVVNVSTVTAIVYLDRISITPLTTLEAESLSGALHLNQPTPVPTNTPTFTPIPTEVPTSREPMLWVSERKHILGDDIPTDETRNYGTGSLHAVWTGSVYAVTYYDRIEGEQLLVFIDTNAERIGDPIFLADYDFALTQLLWDGDALLCVIGGQDERIVDGDFENPLPEIEYKQPMTLMRFKTDGTLLSETILLNNLQYEGYSLNAWLESEILYIAYQRNGEPGNHELMTFSPTGEPLGAPIDIAVRGQLTSVATMGDSFAVLSTLRLSSSFDRFCALQIFDNSESQSIAPITFDANPGSIAWEWPHWNGRYLILLGIRENEDGSESMFTQRFNRSGQMVGAPTQIGTLPPEFSYKQVGELSWTGADYLAVWERRIEGTREGDIFAQLMDADGVPIGEAARVSDRPLARVDHTMVFAENGFSVFTAEKSNQGQSLYFVRLEARELQPAFTPTPTLDPDVPTVTPTSSPVPTNQLVWRGLIQTTFEGVLIEVVGDTVTLKTNEVFNTAETISADFTNPLPTHSVNASVLVLESDGVAWVLEQPRPWNNYTLSVVLEQGVRGSDARNEEIVIRWGDEVQPEPTPTPWPAWNAAEPSPTPIEDAPQVLWIVKHGAFPTESGSGGSDFIEFRNLFTDLGAESDWIVAGSEPITDELLTGYTAVVFGNTFNLPPLADEETASVVRYVRGGGSIFVMGQQGAHAILEPASIYATSVTYPFGIDFSTHAHGSTEILINHPLVHGVVDLKGGGSELIVEPPAAAITAVGDGKVVLAAAENGYGRVVAYSEGRRFTSSEIQLEGRRDWRDKRRFAENIAYWLLRLEETRGPTPTPTPTFVLPPSDTDETAEALVGRMLEANRPWLDPNRIEAEYWLERISKYGTKDIGPWFVDGSGPNPKRVGSIVWSPLHIRNYKESGYDHEEVSYNVSMVGQTLYEGLSVIAVDVVFEPSAVDEIGMSGQSGEGGSSHGGAEFRACRIYIEPQRAVPLLIQYSGGTSMERLEFAPVTWSFEPDFYEVDGGYAPRAFERDQPSFVREVQRFQVVDDVWIYESGDAWRGVPPQDRDLAEHIQTIKLIDLVITGIG